MDIDKVRQHELLLSKWIHEDELIDHRLTWLMVSQTLLFTAYAALCYAAATADAAILQAQCPGKEATLQSACKLVSQIEHIISLVPWIGASVSFLIWIAVIAAIWAIFILKGQHDKAIVIPPENQHEHYGYHRLGISDKTIKFGLVPPFFIPLIFFGVWLYMAWLNYWYG